MAKKSLVPPLICSSCSLILRNFPQIVIALMMLLHAMITGCLNADAASAIENNIKSREELRDVRELMQQQVQHWYQNYSCIFDNTNSFSYLHVGYVSYFNISNRVSFQGSVDMCLSTCTQDCTCAAVVYNTDTLSCYEFHQYIPVQTLPFASIQEGDVLSVYIKVEKGASSNAPLQFPHLHSSPILSIFGHLFTLLGALLVL